MLLIGRGQGGSLTDLCVFLGMRRMLRDLLNLLLSFKTYFIMSYTAFKFLTLRSSFMSFQITCLRTKGVTNWIIFVLNVSGCKSSRKYFWKTVSSKNWIILVNDWLFSFSFIGYVLPWILNILIIFPLSIIIYGQILFGNLPFFIVDDPTQKKGNFILPLWLPTISILQCILSLGIQFIILSLEFSFHCFIFLDLLLEHEKFWCSNPNLDAFDNC